MTIKRLINQSFISYRSSYHLLLMAVNDSYFSSISYKSIGWVVQSYSLLVWDYLRSPAEMFFAGYLRLAMYRSVGL